MALVGLKGGGVVGQESTAISTTQRHPLGAIGIDSSGGEYVYCYGATAALAVGAVVAYHSTAGAFIPALPSTDPGFSTGTGVLLGVNMSTAASTAEFGWVQIFGRSTIAAGASTAVGPGAVAHSSATAGMFSTAPAANLVIGAMVLSSAASTSWEVWLSHPYFSSIAGT